MFIISYRNLTDYDVAISDSINDAVEFINSTDKRMVTQRQLNP